MIKPRVQLLKLGLRSYMPTWTLQKELVAKVKGTKNQNYLILVEHNPVYTTGIRTNVYDSNIGNSVSFSNYLQITMHLFKSFSYQQKIN